jgi:hypothetical protein
VESVHKENHEIAKMVARSSMTKSKKKMKLLQTFNKASIHLAPTPSESINPMEHITIG